jgi:hypothetical protein
MFIGIRPPNKLFWVSWLVPETRKLEMKSTGKQIIKEEPALALLKISE